MRRKKPIRDILSLKHVLEASDRHCVETFFGLALTIVHGQFTRPGVRSSVEEIAVSRGDFFRFNVGDYPSQGTYPNRVLARLSPRSVCCSTEYGAERRAGPFLAQNVKFSAEGIWGVGTWLYY